MAAGSIVIDLLMKTGSFETSSHRASRSMNRLTSDLEKARKAFLALSVGAATAATAWVNSVSKTMDATKKMADQIGITTESLSGLRYAASEMANVSEGTFDMSLRRMTRRISEAADGSGAAKNAIEMLGLSARDLTLLPVEEQFLRVADAIKGAETQGHRLRATMAIFDTEGMPLVNALSQGREEIAKYVEEAQRFGVVISTDAANSAADFQTYLSQLKAAMSGAGITIANEVLPRLNEFINQSIKALSEVDGIRESAEDLKNSNALSDFADASIVVLGYLADSAVFIVKAISAIGGSFKAVVADAEVAMSVLNKAQVWNWFSGDATQKIKDTYAKRNEIVRQANQQLIDLMTYDGARFANAAKEAVAKLEFNRSFVGPMPQSPIAKLPTIDVIADGSGGRLSGGRLSGGGRMSDAGADYIKSLHERIALLGKETEYEQLLAKISVGSMQFRTEAQKQLALETAKQYDQTKQQIELEETLRDLREQQTITQMQFMRELEAYGQGNNMRELVGDLARVEDRYRSIIEARRNSPLGLSDDELELIRASLNTELEMVRQHHEAKRELEANWQLGALEGLRNYADEAANVYKSVSDVVGNAFKGMEDALVDFVMTGKADFKSLANSIISDMMRIAIQQSIMGPLANMFSGMFADGGFVSGFAGGGYTGHGGKYEPAGIVHKGEYVFSKEATQRIGVDRLERLHRGYASGGYVGTLPQPASGSGGVQVNIVNNSKTPVSAQSNARFDGKQMIIDVVLDDLNRNGQISQTLKHLQTA